MWFAKSVEGTHTTLSQDQLLECVLAGRDLEGDCPRLWRTKRTTPAAD